MDLNQLVNNLIVDSKGALGGLGVTADSSIGAFLPELILCGAISVLLLARLLPFTDSVDRLLSKLTGCNTSFFIALAGGLGALVASSPWAHLGGALSSDQLLDPHSVSRMEIFTGMLVYDTFSVYMRAVLLLFLVLFIVFSRLTGIPDQEDGPDLYSLMFGATLGMCLMVSANHLLMIFMAVEMASVPSYVLAGMVKGRRRASEAALKYSIYGAGAAGVMLYGISLLAGVLNSAHLPTMAARLGELLPTLFAGPTEQLMVLSVGGLMLMVGLAFKLSAVPFHFWCPDVFEGATAEVNAFLSIASKAAALGLLVRVSVGLGTVPVHGFAPGERTAIARAAEQAGSAEQAGMAGRGDGMGSAKVQAPPSGSALFVAAPVREDEPAGPPESVEAVEAGNAAATPGSETAGSETAGSETAGSETPGSATPGSETPTLGSAAGFDESELLAGAPPTNAQVMANLAPARNFMGMLIALLAVVTCTFGNLAAYAQTNIKRLLAYSTIAHAGYMMMAVPPILAMAAASPTGAERAAASLAIYIAVYLFMNLGAFAVVAFLRNSMQSEDIADYSGLLKHCPWLVVCFSLILFSLVGLPPLAGFIGKFAIFGALADGYRVTSQGYLLALLIVGGMNTAISLYYYLRVVRVMTILPDPETRTPFRVPFLSTAFVALLTAPTLFFIVGWDGLNKLALAAARYLIS